ncbi:MAG: VWA domain-containing protein [Pseudomonadota bacterium]
MNEIVSNFHFLRPAWLMLLVPSVLVGLLLWRSRAREANWSRVIAPELLSHLISVDSVTRSRSGIPPLIAGWVIATLAAAGPSWQQLPQPVLQKQDALVLILDLSYSMLSTDLQPSRQDRVRRKLLDLLRDREEGLTSLIAYAGDAHIVAPLTDDNPTIANLLPALSPQMMPLPGSNPVEAIALALELLDSAGVRQGRLLLVTDGVRDSDVTEISRLLEGQSRSLAVLGVGTEVGAPIALPGGGFLKDGNGEIVVPALDEAPLRSLASTGGGRYEPMTVDDSDVQRLLADTDLSDEHNTISLDREADQWQDMAHWLILPLLLIALGSFRRGWVYVLPLFILFSPSERAQAFEWKDLWLRPDQQGQRALERGEASEAAALFERNDWRGVAAYTGEDYAAASEAFRSSADADGLYNLGNALAAQGRLDEAISAYEESLSLEPEQPDAIKNIETLKQLQDDQESQQEQSQDDGDPQNSQNQNDSQRDQSGQQNQNGEQKDQQNQAEQQLAPEPPADDQQEQATGDNASNGEPDENGSQGDAQKGEGAKSLDMPQPQIDNSAMQEDLEKDQAMQQWLRRIPDDPSGLLREKFRYESNQRQQDRNRDPSEIW